MYWKLGLLISKFNNRGEVSIRVSADTPTEVRWIKRDLLGDINAMNNAPILGVIIIKLRNFIILNS
jgi:hypothetical protein